MFPKPGDLIKRRITEAQQQLCSSLNTLKRKRPFDPQAKDDAGLEEVRKVFNPKDGAIATLRQALGDLVIKSDGSWSQKPDAPVKLSSEFLKYLTGMTAISDALFSAQDGAPGMKYKMSVQPNKAINQITGTLDGQSVSPASKEYSWPTSKPGVNLRVEQAGGGDAALRGYSGIWGIFQLLSNETHTGGQFRLVNVRGESGGTPQPILPDGSAIVLEVTDFPNGVRQAFDREFFWVSCPKQIFQ